MNWNNLKKILDALKNLVKQGKNKLHRLSNETAWGLSKYLKYSKKKIAKNVSVQNPYNLLNRSYEIGLAEISIREESGLLAYSPLAFGFLSGKYRNNKLPEDQE